MGGGNIQLIYTGIQDDYLTKTPEVTFFKYIYKKYANFAIEQMPITFRENAGFSKTLTCDIPKKGDLLSNMYVRIKLPALSIPAGSTYVGWTEGIGYALIKRVQIFMGDNLIDEQDSRFMYIWDELSKKTGTNDNRNAMVGKYESITLNQTNAQSPVELVVPLNFWFCKDLSLAIPLVALRYHKLKLVLDIASFDDLVTYDGPTPPTQPSISLFELEILIDYIFLEDRERNMIKISDHEFLISQVQKLTQVTKANNLSEKVLFSFNHPVSEILFVFNDKESLNNNDWFNFSIRNLDVEATIQPFIKYMKFYVDSTKRLEQSERQARLVNSQRYHTNCSDKHIYTIPFCDKPESIYPSGSMNFSKINEAILYLDMTPSVPEGVLFMYARNWNVLRIKNGMSSILFAQ
jgi:hypothetical protein